MKIKLAGFFLVALTVLLGLISVPFARANDDWTMFRHDAAHAGYSTSSPSSNVQIWNYSTGNFVYSSPAVVVGIVYVGSEDDKVYALNAANGLKSGTTPLEAMWVLLLLLLEASFT